MLQETAETRALEVLAWLAGQDDLFPVFMGATGASRDDLAVRAADAEFLASVVDFVLMDDAWVLLWANATGQPPESLSQVRAVLPGGDLPNWT